MTGKIKRAAPAKKLLCVYIYIILFEHILHVRLIKFCQSAIRSDLP